MFSEKLRELRKKQGFSMEELAETYNKRFNGKLNKSTLSRYENNLQEPMISVVKNLAEILNVSLDCLTDENSNDSDIQHHKNNIDSAKNNDERKVLMLARHLEKIPEAKRARIIKNFEDTIDTYFEAMGID